MSIHPRSIDWKPDSAPRNGIGRTTSYSSRVGCVWKSATGQWTGEVYGCPGIDCGYHRTRHQAQKRVEKEYSA